MRVLLPPVFAISENGTRAQYRKLADGRRMAEGALAPYSRARLTGRIFQPSDGTPEVLILSAGAKPPKGALHVVASDAEIKDGVLDMTRGRWLRHSGQLDASSFDYTADIAAVRASWANAFSYVSEDVAAGVVGLRQPQLGALHSAHAHWSASEGVATIVMPTGTGKTDTMIALLVSAACERLLVVVPTDALRTQIADKFLSLGVLRVPGARLLASNALYPNVTTLLHVPQSTRELEEILQRSHVLVTTSNIASLCGEELQNRMAETCPYFFIDEAHHAEAPTWKAFKSRFKSSRVLQFTATPFREDGRPLDGRIIYKYPLKKAQAEGYFKPIKFTPVTQYNPQKSDAAIAMRAIEQLRADYAKGHILMARVASVERAAAVYELYKPYTEFKPVQLHSGVKSVAERAEARQQIITGESRIIVCVDMLGEGFDLPELKIAAFHDIRKSLAVTLQLAGRFTRARSDLGDATFIANIADVDVQDELRKLYSRDPDWNVLLPELSEQAIGEQLDLQQFLLGFGNFPDEIPLREVRPATSAVVYRTSGDEWTPHKFQSGIPGLSNCEQVHHSINETEHVLVVVTARRVRLSWTLAETLHDWSWELFIAYWWPEQRLLFINGSSNSGEYGPLARAVCGDAATLIRGQEVFRTFAGITRLRLQNVGLAEELGRNVRFTNRMGSDVEPGVTDLQRRRGVKSIIAGSGFENGSRTGVGASKRGRIWWHRREPMNRFTGWCRAIGLKLADTSINPDDVLNGTLRTDTITTRPNKLPITIDWPEEVYEAVEGIWSVRIDGQVYGLYELSIELVTPSDMGTLIFRVCANNVHVALALELFAEDKRPNCRFTITNGSTAEIVRGEAEPVELTRFFYRNPPVIRFVDGSFLEGNEYIALRTDAPPYDAAKILAWDWTGTNIERESQGAARDPLTIQARVIRELNTGTYDVIVDDDDPGELADVVAIRMVEESGRPCVHVDLYHCKFSGEARPGARVKDLYEVCGQAQKCISWLTSPERQSDMFAHLLRRNEQRIDRGGSTRIEHGTSAILQSIHEVSRTNPVRVNVFIVQPGLSKAKASQHQLELLSVTENHLMETYQLPLQVIASP